MNIDSIIARLHELEEENIRLKNLLFQHGISYEINEQERVAVASKSDNTCLVKKSLSLQEKVDLFQGLFAGREDVFAKDGIAMLLKSQVISQYVNMNGIESFVIRKNISVRNVPIVNLHR